MTVYGEARVARFAKKHPTSRKPLARFLAIAREATWKNLVEVKATFSATDYAPKSGTLIFNIGGDNFRLTAVADFEEQILNIESVMTHEEYDREAL